MSEPATFIRKDTARRTATDLVIRDFDGIVAAYVVACKVRGEMKGYHILVRDAAGGRGTLTEDQLTLFEASKFTMH